MRQFAIESLFFDVSVSFCGSALLICSCLLPLRDRKVVLPVRPAGRSREPEYLVPYQPRCLAALPRGKGKASGVSPEEKKLRQFSYPIVSACLAIGNVGSWGVSEDGVCAAHPHLKMTHLQSTLCW